MANGVNNCAEAAGGAKSGAMKSAPGKSSTIVDQHRQSMADHEKITKPGVKPTGATAAPAGSKRK